MSEKETGGPAFPGPYATQDGRIEALFKQQGMTLRDYFAAKAMQVMCDDRFTEEQIAEASYRMADAMLKARNQ